MKIVIEIPKKDGTKIIIEGSNSEEILKELKILESSIIQSSAVKTSESSDLESSVAEMLKESTTKTISDKILIMFYHLLKTESMPKANVKDIKRLFAEIKEPLPENISALLNNLASTSNGFLKEADKKDKLKAWSLTPTGYKTVEKTLIKKTEDSKQ